MKKYLMIIIAGLGFLLSSCGDPTLDITSVQYEPKLVVEGYLYPGQMVAGIRIMRNFPLNEQVDTTSLYPTDTKVSINGVMLKYYSAGHFFYNDSLIIQPGTTYNLEASGIVDGKHLKTSASTTTPTGDYTLLSSDLGDIRYSDSASIRIVPTSSAEFYAFSIMPDQNYSTIDNFAFDNPFFPNLKREDVEKDLNNFRFQYAFLLNVKKNSADTVSQAIKPFDTWFYAPYNVVVYGGDKNFKDYVLTAKGVKEFDGNFHEPKFHLTGDGIGVFASAIVKTLKFRLIR